MSCNDGDFSQSILKGGVADYCSAIVSIQISEYLDVCSVLLLKTERESRVGVYLVACDLGY